MKTPQNTHLKLLAIAIAAALTFFTSCKKIGRNQCVEPDSLSTDLTWEPLYYPEYPLNTKPEFNPNNPDEIVFLHMDDKEQPSINLIKYNLKTKEHTILHKAYITSRPRWNKKGWILFSIWSNRQEYWKIKGTGDSLTFLRAHPLAGAPEWNKTGDRFIFYSHIETDGHPEQQAYFIADENGTLIDTFPGKYITEPSWQHDSLLAFVSPYGLEVGNPYRGEFQRIVSFDDIKDNSKYSFDPGEVEWIDEDRVIWAHRAAVMITNIHTGVTSVVKETCFGDRYFYPTYSPQNQVLALENRVYHKSKKDDLGIIVVSIHFMNLDGSCEEEFNFSLE